MKEHAFLLASDTRTELYANRYLYSRNNRLDSDGCRIGDRRFSHGSHAFRVLQTNESLADSLFARKGIVRTCGDRRSAPEFDVEVIPLGKISRLPVVRGNIGAIGYNSAHPVYTSDLRSLTKSRKCRQN